MGVVGQRTFGTQSSAQNNGVEEQERVAAQYWINFGVLEERQDEQGKKVEVFKSLPFGMAVDTMKPAKGTGAIAADSNALLEQMKLGFAEFQPGEDRVYPIGETGLYCQFRRIRTEAVAAAPIRALKF